MDEPRTARDALYDDFRANHGTAHWSTILSRHLPAIEREYAEAARAEVAEPRPPCICGEPRMVAGKCYTAEGERTGHWPRAEVAEPGDEPWTRTIGSTEAATASASPTGTTTTEYGGPMTADQEARQAFAARVYGAGWDAAQADGLESARVVKAQADGGLITTLDNMDVLPDPAATAGREPPTLPPPDLSLIDTLTEKADPSQPVVIRRAATTAREPLDALREALASAHRPHRPSCPKDRHPGSHLEPPDPCECGVDDLLALDTPDPGAP